MPFEIFVVPGLICLIIGIRKGLKAKNKASTIGLHEEPASTSE